MKKWLLIALMISVPVNSWAVTITLKSGKDIDGNIIEITNDIVRFQGEKEELQIPLSDLNEASQAGLAFIKGVEMEVSPQEGRKVPKETLEKEAARIQRTQHSLLVDFLKEGELVDMIDTNGDQQIDMWVFSHAQSRVKKVARDLDRNFSVDSAQTDYYREGEGSSLEKTEHDWNVDGRINASYYFDESLTLIKKEIDSDENGKLDVWVHSPGGKLKKMEMDLNQDGRMDLELDFKDEMMARAEIDSNFDGKKDVTFKKMQDFYQWFAEQYPLKLVGFYRGLQNYQVK